MVESISQEQVASAIEGDEWVVGAVNYDEDLHFSSYYLRASLESETAGLYPGYTRLLSFYRGFNERYYLLKEECSYNAQAIITRAESDVGWLAGVLQEIREHCRNLWALFEESEDTGQFHALSDDALLKVYIRHNRTHKELYRWARLPEALDRGVSYFSAYLGNLVREATEDKLNWLETFHKLTQPVAASVLLESLNELAEIAGEIQDDSVLRERVINSPRRARMIMPSGLITKLYRYHQKWKYLNYHGYGDRSLGDMARVVERIAAGLTTTGNTPSLLAIRDQFERRRVERDALLDRLGFGPEHRQFFELYAEIGAVKLERRYAQLRNFFYLDLMITEIALRLHLSEWMVRNMLPEEVIAALGTGLVPDKLAKRCEACAYCVVDGEETILTGPDVDKLLRVAEAASEKHRDRKILKGVVACRGKVTGTCKVVIRADDTAARFRRGEVLVSQSTDPDLLNLLKVAGAVLTEQGGVTSHASLICRELGVPAIVGIPGLLDHVADGDTLEVDAHNGTVRIIEAGYETPDMIIPFADLESSRIGGKAQGLLHLVRIGCRVPEFIFLNVEKLREVLTKKDTHQIDDLGAWIGRRLRIEKGDTVAVRSSATEEDGKAASYAGHYETFLDVTIEALQDVLNEFLRVNDKRAEGRYSGVIIIERMLHPDISGVCITSDPRLGDSQAVVIEAIPGSNVLITQGRINPARFLVDRETGDIDVEKSTDFEIDDYVLDVAAIASMCCNIERTFGHPVDVEWACVGEKLHILQARAVVISTTR